MKQTLYKKNSDSSIQEWTIEVDGDRFRTVSGRLGGNLIVSEWTVCDPKNVGRANETTAGEQALSEAQSRINKKRDREHYFDNMSDVGQQKFIKPMLAHKFDDHKKKIEYPVMSDPKLDGGRGVFSFRGMQTRTGKDIVSAPHIPDCLKPLLDEHPGLVLDGELYNHQLRYQLNEIMKLIRVSKPEKLTPEFLEKSRKMIQYWVYDGWGFNGVTQDAPFKERKAALWELLKGYNRSVIVVKSRELHTFEDVQSHYEDLIKNEFEGQILRWSDCPYLNKRSHTILKRKDFIDDEFEVVGFEEGVGKAKGHAISFVALIHSGVAKGETFSGGFKGHSYEDLKQIWENQNEWIGKKANIRFLNYSPYGKPLIAKLTAWRHDLV